MYIDSLVLKSDDAFVVVCVVVIVPATTTTMTAATAAFIFLLCVALAREFGVVFFFSELAFSLKVIVD